MNQNLNLTPSQMNENIFNELFNTFLGDDSIEECLKKAELLKAKEIERKSGLFQNKSRPGIKRKITVKPEPYQYKYDCAEAQSYLEIGRVSENLGSDLQNINSLNSELHSKEETTANFRLSIKDCMSMDEKVLKKARRKIKNKISAQESRKKKKEYVEGLERRISVFSSVNDELKDRLSELETINREMMEKIKMLTSITHGTSVHTQTNLAVEQTSKSTIMQTSELILEQKLRSVAHQTSESVPIQKLESVKRQKLESVTRQKSESLIRRGSNLSIRPDS